MQCCCPFPALLWFKQIEGQQARRREEYYALQKAEEEEAKQRKELDAAKKGNANEFKTPEQEKANNKNKLQKLKEEQESQIMKDLLKEPEQLKKSPEKKTRPVSCWGIPGSKNCSTTKGEENNMEGFSVGHFAFVQSM